MSDTKTERDQDTDGASFSVDDDLKVLEAMLLIRRFEEKAGQLYGVGYIGGYCHLCVGQEAVAVGVEMARQPGDQVIGTHRNHGQALAAGVAPEELMAEFLGRASGSCGGNGGSMHVFSKDHGFYGGHGIVGATAPLGAGLAFANFYRGSTSVSWCYLGDGAADQGRVYEAFNLSARWRLPVVYVIETNRSALPVDEAVGVWPDLAQRGASFGIEGEVVDGMDVWAVKIASEQAGVRARSGEGPQILEMRTERYRGHSVAAPGKYDAKGGGGSRRTEGDPVERVRARLLEAGKSEAELRTLDMKVRDEVGKAAETAQAASEPGPAELMKDVYA